MLPFPLSSLIDNSDTIQGEAGQGLLVGGNDVLAEGHNNNSTSTVPNGTAKAACSIGGNDATKFSELPPLVRIQRYLVIAEHARWEAAASKDASARQSYLFIAEQWEKFAVDLALYSMRRSQIDRQSRV